MKLKYVIVILEYISITKSNMILWISYISNTLNPYIIIVFLTLFPNYQYILYLNTFQLPNPDI